jgi:hypothetical protein
MCEAIHYWLTNVVWPGWHSPGCAAVSADKTCPGVDTVSYLSGENVFRVKLKIAVEGA